MQVKKLYAIMQATILVLLLVQSVPASAEDKGRIAVVDIQRAILLTEKARAKLEDLKKQADFKANLESIESLQKEYETMVEKYTKDRAVMSAEKREEEERRILDKQQDMKYVASKLQQAEKEYVQSVVQEFGGSTEEVLKNIVKEQNIGLLLRSDGRAVLHADESYDITEQVVERLNAIR